MLLYVHIIDDGCVFLGGARDLGGSGVCGSRGGATGAVLGCILGSVAPGVVPQGRAECHRAGQGVWEGGERVWKGIIGRIVIMGGDGIMGNGEEDNLWRRWRDIENKSLHLDGDGGAEGDKPKFEWNRSSVVGTCSNVVEFGQT